MFLLVVMVVVMMMVSEYLYLCIMTEDIYKFPINWDNVTLWIVWDLFLLRFARSFLWLARLAMPKQTPHLPPRNVPATDYDK